MRRITYMFTALGLLFGGLQSALAQEEPTLKTGQSLGLRITGVPTDEALTLNGVYAVGQAGTIRLQFIGAIKAAGLRPSELAAKIEKAYIAAQIYTKPTINISMSQDMASQQLVTVNGEVKAPRAVAYNSGMRMMSAIAQCSGFTDFADKKKVILVRDGKRSEHDVRSAGSKDDVFLKPGDQIAVRQRGILGR